MALSPRVSFIPSSLSGSQQNDSKTTFFNKRTTPNKKRNAASFDLYKTQKKGFLYHFPKKKKIMASTSAPKPIQNNDHRLHELFEKAVVTLFTSLIGSWLATDTDVYIPGIEKDIRVVLKHL